MLLRSFALIAFAAIELVGPTSTAQAGPLIDWLFGGRRQAPAYPVGAPIPLGNGYGVAPGYAAAGYGGYPVSPTYAGSVAGYPGYAAGYPGYAAGYPGYANAYAGGNYSAGYAPMGMNVPNTGYAANLGTYYGQQLPVIGPSGAGYSAQMPTGIAAATLPQTMSYVPNFNSSALRAPVTYYRPLLTTDPNTGSQVVAMAPCTSYQYLTQRVPALGQSALYGSYQAPQPLPSQPIPSYTLPSGGIPIASNPIGTSTLGGGTALGYSPYSAYQISPPAISGSNTYPTSPVGSNYYNSGPSGGCTGSYSTQPVPGLIAPPASTFPAPSNVAPNYAQPNYSQPDYAQPNYTTPGSVVPPSNGFDPGNSAPSLPPTGALRPRIQSIIPEATPSGSEQATKARTSERSLLSEPAKELPVMNPIPAPEGMEKPSWSPGLLRNEDMTASRSLTRSSQLAGQSKKIHWASFEQALPQQELTLGEPVKPATMATMPARISAGSPAITLPTNNSATSKSRPSSVKQYDTSGWKASR